MRKLFIAFMMAALPMLSMASGGGNYDHAAVDLSDKASLRNGAKAFVSYCLSCHSAKYARYNRMGKDLEISKEELLADYMLASDKVGETMTIAMPEADAKAWFGNPPPDLSVIARARGADWLYTYFRTFYIDESRPFGVNNAVFPDVGMPHVLWELEGMKKAIMKTETDHDGNEHTVISGYEMVTPGTLTPEAYDRLALDLTAFLVYTGEPIQMERKRIGVWVLLFLAIFTVIAYALKKEYWRDIH